jgi:hypothetical protein
LQKNETYYRLKTLQIENKCLPLPLEYFQPEHLALAFTELKEGAEITIGFDPSNALHKAEAVTDCKVVTGLHLKRDYK